MDKFRFDKIKTLLINPDAGVLGTIFMIMKNNGYREFRMGSMLADVIEKLAIRMPDLLIC